MPAISPILTVDVEDWFHVCGDSRYADPSTWESRAKRVHVGVDRLLELLASTSSTATFFVLGWIARKSPALVRRIAEAGHEVGSHGDVHRRLFEMSAEEFRMDLRNGKRILEDTLGRPVSAFRAPEWSMRSPQNPALAVLVEEGFTLDSSLVPCPPVGLASNPTRPTLLPTPSGPILEVPPMTGTFWFRAAILGGGVCSRTSRLARITRLIQGSIQAGVPPVLYVHPWELDPDHPPMTLSPLARLIHFGGRRRTEPRLRAWGGRFGFQPISSARRFILSDTPSSPAAIVRPGGPGDGASGAEPTPRALGGPAGGAPPTKPTAGLQGAAA